MILTKMDYENLRKILDTVKSEGVESAKYLGGLADRLDIRVQSWFDGHITGYRQETGIVIPDADIPLHD